MIVSQFDWDERQQERKARETASSMVAPSVEDVALVVNQKT